MAYNAEDERIGGALCTAILEKGEPCSLTYLQNIPGVHQGTTIEKIIELVERFCQLDIIVKLPDHRYVSSEIADKYMAKAQMQQPRPLPLYERNNGATPPSDVTYKSVPLTQQRKSVPLYERNSSVPPPRDVTYKPVPLVQQATQNPLSKENPVMPDPVQSSAVVQRTHENRVEKVNQTYDCDSTQVDILTDQLRKLMLVLVPGGSPVKASKLAQLTGLGQSKSDVNRLLYPLEKKGILSKVSGSNWTCVRTIRDEELRVCAADLAKVPPSKKNSASQLSLPNTQPSYGASANECPCPNRGGNCNHFHLNQTNNYYQQNVQVGEGNQLFFQGSANSTSGKKES